MAKSPITIAKEALPRSLDVNIQISLSQTEIATDMTLACFLSADAPFLPNNDRVRYYSTFQAAATDLVAGSAAYFAAQAFFSQSPRPETLAVGRVFSAPQAAGLVSGAVDIAALKTIAAGAFVINGATISELDFTAVTDLADVVAVVSGKADGFTASARSGLVLIQSVAVGEAASLTYATAPATGTDVSALLGLTETLASAKYDGYVPGDVVAEAGLVAAVSRANGRPVYGWLMDAAWRESDDALALAAWAEAQEAAILGLVTNTPAAYNAASVSDIAFKLAVAGYARTFIFYHHNPQSYPEASAMARILAVEYGLADATITLKFKTLPGIATSPVTETQLSVLQRKRCNVYTSIGNNAETVRDGVMCSSDWYVDTRVNLDNFREELQVEVFNVFLRRPKIPYTKNGQNMLVSAAAKVCGAYVRNGSFAPRDVESLDSELGYITKPAYQINPTPVYQATASDRAARLAPPIGIEAYTAGAMHKVNISVGVQE